MSRTRAVRALTTSRPRLGGVFARSPFGGGLGDVAVPGSPPTSTDAELDARILEHTQALQASNAAILKELTTARESRKWTLLIGGASALFAAVKLGLVAFPALQARRRGDGEG